MELKIDTIPVRSLRSSSFYLGSAIGLLAWGVGSPVFKYIFTDIYKYGDSDAYYRGSIVGNLLGCFGLAILFYSIMRFFWTFENKEIMLNKTLLLSVLFYMFSFTVLQPGELLQTINDIFTIMFEEKFRSLKNIKNDHPFWPVSYIIGYSFLSFIAASCAESINYLYYDKRSGIFKNRIRYDERM